MELDLVYLILTNTIILGLVELLLKALVTGYAVTLVVKLKTQIMKNLD